MELDIPIIIQYQSMYEQNIDSKNLNDMVNDLLDYNGIIQAKEAGYNLTICDNDSVQKSNDRILVLGTKGIISKCQAICFTRGSNIGYLTLAKTGVSTFSALRYDGNVKNIEQFVSAKEKEFAGGFVQRM